MTVEPHPSTLADCLQWLTSVLTTLDELADGNELDGNALTLAAVHIQTAMELIHPSNPLDP